MTEPDLKLHAGAIQPGTRILYFWILPERALSFPLNKGYEGSEKEMERQGRVKPLREIFLKHLFHEIAKRLNQLT